MSESALGRHARCHEYEGPPCLTLLSDPVHTMSEPGHWPQHLCMTVAKRLTQQAWYAHRTVTGRDTRTTIELHLAMVPGQEEPLLAFDAPDRADGAHIACGLTLPLPDAQIVFWGLARPNEDGMATVAGCTFELSGPKPDAKEVLRLVKSCRHWWSGFAGMKVTGRGLDSCKFPREVRDQMARQALAWKATGLSWEEIAWRIREVDVDTIRGYVDRFEAAERRRNR